MHACCWSKTAAPLIRRGRCVSALIGTVLALRRVCLPNSPVFAFFRGASAPRRFRAPLSGAPVSFLQCNQGRGPWLEWLTSEFAGFRLLEPARRGRRAIYCQAFAASITTGCECLDQILDGDLGEYTDALQAEDRRLSLEAASA